MKTYLVEILDTAGFEITRKYLTTKKPIKELAPWIKTFCEFPFKYDGKNTYIVDDPINTVDIVFYESECYIHGNPKYTYEINFGTDYIGDKYIVMTDSKKDELSSLFKDFDHQDKYDYYLKDGMRVYIGECDHFFF